MNSSLSPEQEAKVNRFARPLVSIIIPVFNDQERLSACVKAIAEQDYPLAKMEVIVVDNGSTPATELPDTPSLSARVVRCEKPGSYCARNVGAGVAVGSVLAFTDADCTPKSKWVSAGVTALFKADGDSIVGGEVIVTPPVPRNGTSLYQHATGFQQESNIRDRGFSVTANLFCTMNQFQKVGPFDEMLLSGGDREWCWRALQLGYSVLYEPTAVVTTEPRVKLRDAIRQARRVAGGRAGLAAREPALPAGLRRQRKVSQSIAWIWSLPHLSTWERLRVLAAAAAIRASDAIESVRLHLGQTAERR